LPAISSERLIKEETLREGSHVVIKGQFRSYNNPSKTGNKLILTVFVREIEVNPSEEPYYYNEVVLEGTV
jgi:hypothetical protein